MLDVPAQRPVSKGAVFLDRVLRDVILTDDLSRADGDFSRTLGSNLLCVVAMLAAQKGLLPRRFCNLLETGYRNFPRIHTKLEMTPWSFLPSFPTSQEAFTLFLKYNKNA